MLRFVDDTFDEEMAATIGRFMSKKMCTVKGLIFVLLQ